MAIAQSVFTHVSLNQMRLCLYRLARVMRPGGTFYATFCERQLSNWGGRYNQMMVAYTRLADAEYARADPANLSATMTLDLYGHLFEDRLGDVADALDRAAAASLVASTLPKSNIVSLNSVRQGG
jgi:hypothetical protein